jgi:hypothetical protein
VPEFWPHSQYTKYFAAGREATNLDKTPLPVGGGVVDAVDEFPYLGSTIAASGRMDCEVGRRIAMASRAFGALRRVVFLDKNLNLKTKKVIYQACVISILLYGSECWTLSVSYTSNQLNSRTEDTYTSTV